MRIPRAEGFLYCITLRFGERSTMPAAWIVPRGMRHPRVSNPACVHRRRRVLRVPVRRGLGSV